MRARGSRPPGMATGTMTAAPAGASTRAASCAVAGSQDELRGEGGDEGPEGAVGEGEALGPGSHQSGGEAGPAEPAAGQRAHLRGEVQAYRPEPLAGHPQEQVARPMGQFQHRPAGDEG